MGLLVFSIRKQQLLRRKSDIEMRQVVLSQKLNDLQSYASSIGSGQPSLNTFMGVPSSLFGRLQGYMQFSSNMAQSIAESQFKATMATPGAQQYFKQSTGGNVQAMQYMENMMKQQYYEKALDQASAQEKQNLNRQEQRIESEVTEMEQQGK